MCLQDLFAEVRAKHPTVSLPYSMETLTAMLAFIYKGEVREKSALASEGLQNANMAFQVSVDRSQMAALLEAATALGISGLSPPSAAASIGPSAGDSASQAEEDVRRTLAEQMEAIRRCKHVSEISL